jgi:coproporphyrinogen III oxidase-like Fe-S oxidoreductase
MNNNIAEQIKQVARGLIIRYATPKEMLAKVVKTAQTMFVNVGMNNMSETALYDNVNQIIDMLEMNHNRRQVDDMMIGLRMGSMGYFGGERYISVFNMNHWLDKYIELDLRQKSRLEVPPLNPDAVYYQYRRIPDKEYLQLVFNNVRCGMSLELLNYKDIYNLLLQHGYLRSHLKDASLEALVAKFSTRSDPEWVRDRKQREAVISEIDRCFLDRISEEKLSFLEEERLLVMDGE